MLLLYDYVWKEVQDPLCPCGGTLTFHYHDVNIETENGNYENPRVFAKKLHVICSGGKYCHRHREIDREVISNIISRHYQSFYISAL